MNLHLLPNPDEAVVVVVAAVEPKPNALDAVVFAPNDPKENPGASYHEKTEREKC